MTTAPVPDPHVSAMPAVLPPVVIEPEVVRIRVACRLLGVGPSAVRQMMAEGELAWFTIGQVRVIPVESVRAMVRRRAAACAEREAARFEAAKRDRARRNERKRDRRQAEKAERLAGLTAGKVAKRAASKAAAA